MDFPVATLYGFTVEICVHSETIQLIDLGLTIDTLTLHHE